MREYRSGHGFGGDIAIPKRQEHEPTPAERALQATTIADNLDNAQKQVTGGIEAMAVAHALADPAAWQQAKEKADSAIKLIAKTVDAAVAAKEHATDEKIATKLGGAETLADDMRTRLAAAPAKPERVAPVLSCQAELLAVLPPDEPIANTYQVYGEAERAVEAVFRGAMLWSDIVAFGDLLANFPNHPITRRFGRLRERTSKLKGILGESKLRARARAMEAARQQVAPLVTPPPGYSAPVMAAAPAERDSPGVVDAPAVGDRGEADAEPAAPSVTPAPDAGERTDGTTIDARADGDARRPDADEPTEQDAPGGALADAATCDHDVDGATVPAEALAVPAEGDPGRATIDGGGGGPVRDEPAKPERAAKRVGAAPHTARRAGPASASGVAERDTLLLAVGQSTHNAHGPVTADPVLASGGRELDAVGRHLRAVSGLLDSYQVAAGFLDVDTVAESGLMLANAWEAAQLALGNADSALASANALGPVGLGFESDPDGTKHAARAAELARLQARAADLRQSANEWAMLVANRVRPSTFRREPVAGVAAQMPPTDLANHVRQQTVKGVLLLDSLQEMIAILDAAKTDTTPDAADAADAARKVAAHRLQFWISDRDGFLFLTHALQRLGHGYLLLQQAFDGKTLLQAAAAVSRGVPQTFADIIDTLREAKERSLDSRVGPQGDQAGAAKLVELAQERLNEVVRYDRLLERIPHGTHGLTLEHAWYFAQGAQSATSELWRMAMRGQLRPSAGSDRLWDHQILQVQMAEQPIQVLSGEVGYEQTFLKSIGPASDASVAMAVAVGAIAIGGPAAIEAAPFLLARLAIVAEAGAAMFAAAKTWALANPQAALALTEFIASIGLNIGENGLGGFLEQLQTPEGMLQIAMDALMLWASMGGPSQRGAPDDAQPAPRAGRPADDGGGFKNRALDVVDKIRATKQAVVEYAKTRGARLTDPDAVPADGPGGIKMPAGTDELPDYSTIYAQRLDGIRGERAARGFRGQWPKPEERLQSGYVAPPANADTVKIRERLMDEAKKHYPVDPSMPNEQKADLHHKQAQYFETVEQGARNKREQLEAELRDAPPERHASLNDEIELARRTEAAAMVRPAQGSLPINHRLAGSYVTIDDIDAKLADLTLNRDTRDTLQMARKLMIETGRTRVRYSERGHIELDEWTYEVSGKKARYPGPLSVKTRDADDRLARKWYREQIGDPGWMEPDGYTWHHHEDVGAMILVPTAVHDAFKHTGPIPFIRVLTGDYNAYH
jgi:hypothetical protein